VPGCPKKELSRDHLVLRRHQFRPDGERPPKDAQLVASFAWDASHETYWLAVDQGFWTL